MTRIPGDPRTLRADADAPITVVRAGTVPYLDAWAWQQELAARRTAGDIGDVLLLLEHPRVYTLGRRADETNLVFDGAERERRGIELHRIDRGGDVTYHGPGQLVGYPIWKLDGPRVVDHVRTLEEINLRVLSTFGVTGERVAGFSGVWVGDAKVTAIGVHVTAGAVTTHGWATNVTSDLADFAGIVPCGITDKRVTTLATLGVDTDVDEVADRTERCLIDVVGADLRRATITDLGLQVGTGQLGGAIG
ncbi:lipoyl(octanoyl) transferase LipB [Nitriliruptor alkaliphilus]|uniref:lipoyl(octanoyl) transferase LipB n=1 Tax=Nitriliruptor alkaliphilus TaxID=427918 RepID=UPI000AFA3AE7|nr:lipoyl(octanoyl) transferase LipB [Nitriliruptor alkaliphilus]